MVKWRLVLVLEKWSNNAGLDDLFSSRRSCGGSSSDASSPLQNSKIFRVLNFNSTPFASCSNVQCGVPCPPRFSTEFLVSNGQRRYRFLGAVSALRCRFHCRLGRAAVPPTPSVVAAPCYTPLLPPSTPPPKMKTSFVE